VLAVWYFVPGFLNVSGDQRRPSGTESGLTSGSRLHWFIGDDCHHNGALFLPRLQLLCHVRPASAQTDSGFSARFEHCTPNGYRFFLDLGPVANTDRKYLKGDVAALFVSISVIS
jgi:uncharacterized protein